MPQVFALGAAIFAGTAIAWTTVLALIVSFLFMSK